MDLEEKLTVVKQNTAEVVTEDELQTLLSTNEHPVTYCGYEPSGPLHLGHMITVTKLVDLERVGCRVKILLADLHALLNLKGDESYIADQVRTWKKTMGLLGLKHPEFVTGSSFQLEAEYWKDIMAMATSTTIKRGLRSMQEVARDVENAHISQMLYPLMQAEDIKALSVEIAQSGIEQRKIHMLAREQLPGLGWRAPVCVHTPLITSLVGPGSKMSSSVEGSNISVVDSAKTIKTRLKKAYCPEGVVEDNPVLQLAKLLVFPRKKDGLLVERKPKFGGDIHFGNYKELEQAFVDKAIHPLDVKIVVADELENIIQPIREEFEKLT